MRRNEICAWLITSPLVALRTYGTSDGAFRGVIVAAGGTFALARNRFSGSYFALISRCRS